MVRYYVYCKNGVLRYKGEDAVLALNILSDLLPGGTIRRWEKLMVEDQDDFFAQLNAEGDRDTLDFAAELKALSEKPEGTKITVKADTDPPKPVPVRTNDGFSIRVAMEEVAEELLDETVYRVEQLVDWADEKGRKAAVRMGNYLSNLGDRLRRLG